MSDIQTPIAWRYRRLPIGLEWHYCDYEPTTPADGWEKEPLFANRSLEVVKIARDGFILASDKCQADLVASQAEVERLREALRQIVAGAEGSPTHGSLAQIARRALGKEETKG